MKESIMSDFSLVGAFDDIVRSTSVLAEGIEGGLWSDSLFLSSSFRLDLVVRKQTHSDLQLESLIALSYIHSFWHSF